MNARDAFLRCACRVDKTGALIAPCTAHWTAVLRAPRGTDVLVCGGRLRGQRLRLVQAFPSEETWQAGARLVLEGSRPGRPIFHEVVPAMWCAVAQSTETP
jgi:hypothetical protein